MFSCSYIPSFRSKNSLILVSEMKTDKANHIQDDVTTTSIFTLISFHALEVLQQIFNNQYSWKEDFGGGFHSDSGEEGTDYNQHHPLVPDLVAENIGDITYV